MFWTHQEVRKLLRLMRRPPMLERERLAVLLRESLQTRDARTALQSVIEAAFDPSNHADRLRLDIVRRCDVGGETTREAAATLNLSIRQFFRYRADAIAAIAQSMERALRRPPDSQSHLLLLARNVESIDPKAALDIYQRAPEPRSGQVSYNIVRTSVWAGLDVSDEQIDACEGPWRLQALAAVARHLISQGANGRAASMRHELRAQLRGGGPGYDAVAFELAFLDRCEACRRGDARECREHLESMRALAGNNEELVALALLAEVDQALIEGDWTAAAIALDDVELLDVHGSNLNVMARTALGKAMLSLVRGFHEEAFALANGAGPAIAALEGGVALRAAAVAGRAAMFCGARWGWPTKLLEKYPNVWTKACAQAVISRHVLAADAVAARAEAEAALALATRHESPVHASYARVSLAGALDHLGDGAQAQSLRIEAWSTALRCRDEFALYDLFHNPNAEQHDLGAMRLEKRFIHALQAHCEEEVPAYASGVIERETSQAILESTIRATMGVLMQSGPNTAIRHLGAGLSHKGAGEAQHHQVLAAVGRKAARAVSFCLAPKLRQRFEERFALAWEERSSMAASSGKDVARAV